MNTSHKNTTNSLSGDDLDRALAENRFHLYLQPVVSVSDQYFIRQYEILLRLTGEKMRVVPTNVFIPAAERAHRMNKIDRWVIDEVLQRMASDSDGNKRNYAINLSGQSLDDDGLLDYIRRLVQEHSIDARRLCFEITENVAINEVARAVPFIEGLKSMGCSFALDDFGSGLSSFTALKSLPVDFVKIDGRLTRVIAEDPIERTMVETIARVAHELSMQTIAEFVENQEVVAMLAELGVDYMQGYHVGLPEPWS